MATLTDLWEDMKRAYENDKPYYWIAFFVGVIVAGFLGNLLGAF